MPYVITTRAIVHPQIASRRAVATLDEVRRHVGGIVTLNRSAFYSTGFDAAQKQIAALGESGGSVGPLPDGTTIEVQAFDTDSLSG